MEKTWNNYWWQYVSFMPSATLDEASGSYTIVYKISKDHYDLVKDFKKFLKSKGVKILETYKFKDDTNRYKETIGIVTNATAYYMRWIIEKD